MESKFPKGFALAIAIMLMLLLAGYLWLADIVPKTSPLRDEPQTQNTASEPQLENITDWDEYRDPKFGFSLRHPSSWQPTVVDGQAYEVHFKEPGASAENPTSELIVKVFPDTKLSEITAALKAKSSRGLFPPTEIAKLTLADGSDAPTFYNYSTPRGDASISSSALEKDGAVYLFEFLRSVQSPDYHGAFPIYVRSFAS